MFELIPNNCYVQLFSIDNISSLECQEKFKHFIQHKFKLRFTSIFWCDQYTHPRQENSSDVVNGVTSILLMVDLSWPTFGRTNEEYRDGISRPCLERSCIWPWSDPEHGSVEERIVGMIVLITLIVQLWTPVIRSPFYKSSDIACMELSNVICWCVLHAYLATCLWIAKRTSRNVTSRRSHVKQWLSWCVLSWIMCSNLHIVPIIHISSTSVITS